MSATRRVLVLIGLTLAVIAGSSIPASATFAETVALPQTSIATGTVAAPATVTVTDSCITTTTTVKRTTRYDSATGLTTPISSNSSSTSAASTFNDQGRTTSTSTAPGPTATTTDTTTTTVSWNTDLLVTASWTASASRGVTGYLVTAHLGYDGSSLGMAQTVALSTSARVDADYLFTQPSLSITTLTSYGWTAMSAATRVLSC